MSIPKEELKQKCSYYNGRKKCAFFGQEKCIYDNGMVPFPYICGVESQMEEQATEEESASKDWDNAGDKYWVED